MRKLIPILLLALACRSEENVKSAVATDAASSAPLVQRVAETRATPMIVRTADLRITVADTAKAVDAVTKSIEAGGGFVSASNVWRESGSLRARLTLRVPANRLTATLASIRGIAKRVENEVVTSNDVSQEYVDLGSQLRNLQATEEELRELLKVARVNTRRATEVLEVHQQLTAIRGQIEQTTGRMRYLSQVTSMSTVNVDMEPEVLAPGWYPSRVAREATGALMVLMQNLATGAIWFVIYLLPVLAMLALGVSLLVKILRRTRTVS